MMFHVKHHEPLMDYSMNVSRETFEYNFLLETLCPESCPSCPHCVQVVQNVSTLCPSGQIICPSGQGLVQNHLRK